MKDAQKARLKALRKTQHTSQETPIRDPERLIEGVDYTVENGLMILSRTYLLKRGTCCGSGCRNCPYGDAL